MKIWFRLVFSFVPCTSPPVYVLSRSRVACGAGPGIAAFLPKAFLVFCSSDSYWARRETEENGAMFWGGCRVN